MKKIIFITLLVFLFLEGASAQSKAEIKFDKTVHNFGTFTENEAMQKCTFTFTNTGSAPLVINQAMASCGCTVPSYTKKPVAPGEKGTLTVTYNGKGRTYGHFKKTITVRTNGQPEMTRIYIEGVMEAPK